LGAFAGEPAYAARGCSTDPFFLGGCSCLGVILGFVLLLGACFWFVQPSMIPVESLMDQRGGSCFRNRGLGFKIRADSGRFLYPLTALITSPSAYCSVVLPGTGGSWIPFSFCGNKEISQDFYEKSGLDTRRNR
jgi:hypothetical protein